MFHTLLLPLPLPVDQALPSALVLQLRTSPTVLKANLLWLAAQSRLNALAFSCILQHVFNTPPQLGRGVLKQPVCFVHLDLQRALHTAAYIPTVRRQRAPARAWRTLRVLMIAPFHPCLLLLSNTSCFSRSTSWDPAVFTFTPRTPLCVGFSPLLHGI